MAKLVHPVPIGFEQPPGYVAVVPGYSNGIQQGYQDGALPGVMPAQEHMSSEPSAPSLDKMDQIQGYHNVTFGDDRPLAPPSYDDAMRNNQPPPRQPLTGLPIVNEDEARQALLGFVSEHCCYGKSAAQEMAFRDMKSSSAFHYILETFTETRNTAWAFEPYRGMPIDSPMNGPAPGPWDIPMTPPSSFQDNKAKCEIPHTASVKPCHKCMGMGRVRCVHCHGMGQRGCTSCGGSGRTYVFQNGTNVQRHCNFCNGNGRQMCHSCQGSGQIQCGTCHGAGNLKCFIQLTVHWQNRLEDYIQDRTGLPDDLIRKVTGQVAFQEEHPRVWPINHFPEAAINQASANLVAKHASAFPLSRILAQRHRVRIIPVTEVTYNWKNEADKFHVYGLEKKVYAPNYPQKCCCVIL